MYPSAITHIVAAQIDEQRHRDAELARRAQAIRSEPGRLTRALVAIGQAVPAATFGPWLAWRG